MLCIRCDYEHGDFVIINGWHDSIGGFAEIVGCYKYNHYTLEVYVQCLNGHKLYHGSNFYIEKKFLCALK